MYQQREEKIPSPLRLPAVCTAAPPRSLIVSPDTHLFCSGETPAFIVAKSLFAPGKLLPQPSIGRVCLVNMYNFPFRHKRVLCMMPHEASCSIPRGFSVLFRKSKHYFSNLQMFLHFIASTGSLFAIACRFCYFFTIFAGEIETSEPRSIEISKYRNIETTKNNEPSKEQ